MPEPLVQPHLMGTSGHIAPDKPLPSHPNDVAGLIHALASEGLLAGRLVGTVVVRIAGRAWEMWVFGDEPPAPLDDMLRYFANRRFPAADGVGFAQIAERPTPAGPQAILQIVAERGGNQVRAWAPLVFPDGPGTSARLGDFAPVEARTTTPLTAWLGVPPEYDLVLETPES